jgi:hypothetical protein
MQAVPDKVLLPLMERIQVLLDPHGQYSSPTYHTKATKPAVDIRAISDGFRGDESTASQRMAAEPSDKFRQTRASDLRRENHRAGRATTRS